MATLFTDAQREFLRAQRCGRLLTVDPVTGPAASPVLYQMHGDVVVGGGVDLAATPAWDDLRRGRAVFVVDEIVPGEPPRSRGVRLEAAAVLDAGPARPVVRLRAERVEGWGF